MTDFILVGQGKGDVAVTLVGPYKTPHDAFEHRDEMERAFTKGGYDPADVTITVQVLNDPPSGS